jgi:hypothetical protein
MSLEATVKRDHTIDDFVSMEQQRLENDPDESELSCK